MTGVLKSQVSIEFMSFVLILILILFVVVSNTSILTSNIINERRYSEGKKLADAIASEINIAIKAGDGYSRKFFINDNIFGVTNFLIIVGNYTVIVDWGSSFASSPTLVKSVQGNFSKGWNIIKNSNGVIYVS
jgi:hypothetical protein